MLRLYYRSGTVILLYLSIYISIHLHIHPSIGHQSIRQIFTYLLVWVERGSSDIISIHSQVSFLLYIFHPVINRNDVSEHAISSGFLLMAPKQVS